MSLLLILSLRDLKFSIFVSQCIKNSAQSSFRELPKLLKAA